jgi:hypothetical protein
MRGQAREAYEDQVNRDDVVQESGSEEDQDARDERDQRLEHPHIDHHGWLRIRWGFTERLADAAEAVIILRQAE